MLALAGLVGVVLGMFGTRTGYGATRRPTLVIIAGALQLMAIPLHGRVSMAVLACSVSVALAWLLVQRHLASWLVAIGSTANLCVIAINGGMPVDPHAVRTVGGSALVVAHGRLYDHIPMDTGTRLRCLADRIPIPIHRSVISVGDMFMMAGTAIWIANAVRRWRAFHAS